MDLTTPQRQAIVAMLDRAMTASTSALSEMVDGGMVLSIVDIEAVCRATAARRLGDGAQSRPAVAVRQSFSGWLDGEAMLVFCERQSLMLVRTLLADTVPLEVMTDLEQDALVEIGNVVLNACLASVARELEVRLTSGLPDYRRGPPEALLSVGDGETLFAHLGVVLGEEDVDGYLLVTLDHRSGHRFRERIDNPPRKALV